jgi:energy-coupling factor transport system ATP-binding protein
VGLVLEDVEAQLFNASVADEVAFGLEGLGLPPSEIEVRIQSALKLVGLTGFERRVPRTLSGGQQKRLALASVLAMRPQFLVLDEPTSGLDPRGRNAVLSAIDRLRRSSSPSYNPRGELRGGAGMTVLMATQDAEAAARFADRVLILRQGKTVLDGSPRQVFAQVERLDAWGIAVPQMARLANRLAQTSRRSTFFLDPRSAAQALSKTGFAPGPGALPPSAAPHAVDPAIEVCALGHRYAGAKARALSDVDLGVRRGEWLAIVGVNGSGKSTLIRHFNGLLKPSEGRVTVEGQDTRASRVGELARTVSLLPQNPALLLFSATVRQEVGYGPRQLGLRGTALETRVADTLELLGLSAYADHPPAALGFGLRRQVALASILAMEAPILVLDEPTAGLDRGSAERLLNVIAERHRRGTTVIMVTHDLHWVVRYAQRTAVLHEGHVDVCGPSREVLADLELLARAGLDPLPVTALGSLLDLTPPLPLSVQDLLSRIAHV